MFSCQLSIKMPLKRKSLAVQGDCGDIIDIERTECCFLSVYVGNVSLNKGNIGLDIGWNLIIAYVGTLN
jgi:hypothetical protein